MNPLFARSSLVILESLSFTRSLYAFDFDGTLSRIVSVPSQAVLADTTAALLRELSALAPVAIISGRSIEDLRQRLPFTPPYLVGNHGLEGLGEKRDDRERAAATCRLWRTALESSAFGPGVEIEDKTYSLAVHYRRSRSKKADKERIRQAIAALSPVPRTILGKAVFNLLPEGAPHKGAALVEIMRQAGVKHAFYIGDDDTDEDVFGLPDEQIVMTVRVGERKVSQARYFIERQSEINRVLQCLIRFHSPRPGDT